MSYASLLLFRTNDSYSIWYPIAILFFTKASYTILRKGDFFQFEELRNHIQSQEFPFFVLGFVAIFFSRPNTRQLIILAIAVILTIVYGMHVFFKNKRKSLRSSAIVKLIAITTVWVLVVVVVPIFKTQTHLVTTDIWHILMQFCFVLSMTIPFDITDYARQAKIGFSTLPNLYGIAATKKIARGCIILTWIFAGLQGKEMVLLMSVLVIIFLGFLQQVKEGKNLAFVSLRFDGLLLVQALTLCLISILGFI